ncbi:hypothetical protein ABMA27_012418 [Loxostege sticticalis]|uniref:Uncharacterized protein n=1 Tax=Loxostege sticticalis TaxID=481309 RepID=A0ABR3H1A2_LOXSC
MGTINVCRICLGLESRMFSLTTKPLKDFYEKITKKPFNFQDDRPSVVCYICYHLLKKCYRFTQSAIKADEVLQQLFCSGNEITEKPIVTIDKTFLFTSLNKSRTECIVAIDTNEVSEDIEVPIVKDEHLDIKRETALDAGDTDDEKEGIEPQQSEDPHHSSDSEDDVPLKSISLKKTEIRVEKRMTKKIGLIKKIKNVIKADAREITLTKEEQMQQMLERAKSLNYLHSPHKCSLCYKGFVDLKAFENHKEKHDERSGPFECEICHMRYRTVRHLRTHAHTCHARQYACNKCAHRSHTANQAREHEKWHNGYTYECQLCSQKFRKPTSYLTHMRKRHPTEHVCNICGHSFVGSHGLRMHKSKAHAREHEKQEIQESDQKFCSECNIQFISLDAWKRHILSSVTHALGNESNTTCLACGAQVAGASLRAHLLQHERADAGPRVQREKSAARLPCEQCGTNFVNRSKLQAHIKRIHLGLKYNKNIVCEVCGKKCTSNASLKYHQRTHTGERPFSCTLCAKRFADKNQLRIHVRTHTGERPYCCAVCGKRFSQKPALNRHYRVHTGAKPYDCQFCSKTFSQSNSLKLHVNTVHLKLPHAKKKALASEQSAQQDS